MSKAKITLIGMYHYDNTIFNDIKLPELVDKDNLINQILLEYGEFEVLYPFSEFFKNSINHFFSLNFNLFNRWAETLNIEYDPLENFNRHEEWSDSKDTTDTNTASSTTQSSGSTSQNNKISAFDGATMSDDTSSSGSASSTNTTSDRNTLTGEEASEHSGHLWGNIGVTTSQQMLEAEMEVREKWQLEKIIADLFAENLLVLVYD